MALRLLSLDLRKLSLMLVVFDRLRIFELPFTVRSDFRRYISFFVLSQMSADALWSLLLFFDVRRVSAMHTDFP